MAIDWLHNLITRGANEKFDRTLELAINLGFKVRFIDSTEFEAGLDFETDDGRNIFFKVNGFSAKSTSVGYFSYAVFLNHIDSERKQIDVNLNNLKVVFRNIKQEMTEDQYFKLNRKL